MSEYIEIKIPLGSPKLLQTEGKVCEQNIGVFAEREWVMGYFNDLPIENTAVRVVGKTLEGIINTALNIGGGGNSICEIEKGTYVYLSRKYNWTIEPAEALVGGDELTDFVDFYVVKGDFTVTCNGIKTPRIYLDKSYVSVDEYGELRPPIIATIYGCPSYDTWVGICDADATEYTYESLNDHWGYVQLGGDNVGGVYSELNTDLIPPDESTVVISRGNLCRNSNTILTPGNYKLVLFDSIKGDTYTPLATAQFTLK